MKCKNNFHRSTKRFGWLFTTTATAAALVAAAKKETIATTYTNTQSEHNLLHVIIPTELKIIYRNYFGTIVSHFRRELQPFQVHCELIFFHFELINERNSTHKDRKIFALSLREKKDVDIKEIGN